MDVVKMFQKMPIWKKVLIALIVLIPVLVGLWFLNYVSDVQTAATSVFPSPIDSTPIIITLVLFMSGYILFLIIMFYDNIRELIKKRVMH